MANVGEFVRVTYGGRPVFHGERDPRTGRELSGGWEMDYSQWFVQWDSRVYDLPVGKDVFVPFEAAMSAFGDPRSGERIVSVRDQHGRVGFIPDRATEVRRLRTKYDNMFGDETVIEHFPIAEVYELDGTRIVTVLDDPQGTTVKPAKQTQSEHGELLEVVRRQQQTISALMERVGINPDGTLRQQDSPAPPSPAASQEASEASDEPEQAPEPPEDDTALSVGSEARSGERGGRRTGDPALDWSTLNAES